MTSSANNFSKIRDCFETGKFDLKIDRKLEFETFQIQTKKFIQLFVISCLDMCIFSTSVVQETHEIYLHLFVTALNTHK